MNILKEVEKEQIAKLCEGKDLPAFKPGDTLKVHTKVKEGDLILAEITDSDEHDMEAKFIKNITPTSHIPFATR